MNEQVETKVDKTNSSGTLALALGGGGARAAYQAGFLHAVAEHFPFLDIPILTGVSAGAINTAFLANHAAGFQARTEQLCELWSSLRTQSIFDASSSSLGAMVLRWGMRLVSGGSKVAPRPHGMVDTTPLRECLMKNLGADGVIRVGAEVKPGDILVGKITPKSETELAPEERLLRAIFGEKAADVKDTSLKVPSGTYGIVMDVKVSSKKESDQEKVKPTPTENKKAAKQVTEEYKAKKDELSEQLTEALSNILLGEKIPLDVVNSETGEIIIPANRKITKTLLRKLAGVYDRIEIDPSPIRNKINEIIGQFKKKFDDLQMAHDEEMERAEAGDETDVGIIKQVKVYIASKRKLSVGDKMAGRHGNKGVVAKIVAEEDLPFLEDGTPVDIVLNPLGVPSRMNVGQVLETHLGWAAKLLGLKFATPVFDGIKEKEIRGYLKEAKLPEHAKVKLTDGRTGEQFDQEIVVGYIYMMKLGHLVADKIHARAVGPYSLVTQQPLGGKAQYGGQRFGEMEVWAMEAYGAAYTLQELLTVKSDDVQGRTRIYESIVKGDNSLEAGIPESFNVLVKEMQSLGMDVKVGYTNQLDAPAEPNALASLG